MYKSFQRSTQASKFTDYSYDDATIAWIDILNVRNKKHAEITAVMRRVLDLAAEATSTGLIFEDDVYVGTPNSAVQYAIVGDTVVMVEKYQPETRDAAKLALFYRASLFSKMLFANDLLHRGVIVDGPVDCFKKDHNTIVTGAGVIMAYTIESKINCSGLFIHDSCALLRDAGRLKQINKFVFLLLALTMDQLLPTRALSFLKPPKARKCGVGPCRMLHHMRKLKTADCLLLVLGPRDSGHKSRLLTFRFRRRPLRQRYQTRPLRCQRLRP